MSVVRTLLGNVKGPQGDTGATGAQGAQGDAATISVGSVTTTAYGNPAQVTNSGTEGDAVFDFVIPQGKPGEATTKMGDLSLDAITTSTASFPSPQVGDTGKTAFGKIVKFFADTVAALAAKIDTSKIADNLTTNDASYVLSAKQGKALNDSLTSRTTWRLITEVSTSVGGVVDRTETVDNLNNYKELLFTIQVNNGRTAGSTLCTIAQFQGGAIYANGINGIGETIVDAAAVCVWLSDTSVEIATNTAINNVSQKFRLYGR